MVIVEWPGWRVAQSFQKSLVALSGSMRGRSSLIRVDGARPHALLGLFRIMATMQFSVEGLHALKILAVAVFTEFDGGTVHFSARIEDCIAQIEIGANVACQAADIIEHDHIIRRGLVAFQELQKFPDAGAVNKLSRHSAIIKDTLDLIPFGSGMFAAAGFLRPQAIPFASLAF